MTTSIKSATAQETKQRINELFGNINSNDIVVIEQNPMPVNLNDMRVAPNTSSINVGTIENLKERISNHNIKTTDVGIVKTESGFEIKSGTNQDLQNKLDDLGFGDLTENDIAIVKAEDLEEVVEKTNTVKRNNSFRK